MNPAVAYHQPAAAIASHHCYNAELKKPICEKLWFADLVDADVIVDFGCADGTVMKALSDMSSRKRAYIGYDIDAEQCAAGREQFPASLFTDRWEEVVELLTAMPDRKKCLVLSSVIHELLSDPSFDLSAWWAAVSAPFDTVVIRDMAVSKSATTEKTPDAWVEALHSRAENDLPFATRMAQFQSVWGTLSLKKPFLHFMLKYRYIANWTREMGENYIPLAAEDMYDQFATHGFEVAAKEHAILPWLNGRLESDFGIDVNDATHVKMILKRSLRG